MQRTWEIETSQRIVLGCGCGERLVLLGREVDWYAEGRSTFERECGEELALADRGERRPRDAELLRSPAFFDGK